MSAPTYLIYNGHMPTTAAPVKVTTGTAILTTMQISTLGVTARIIEWGISFDGFAAALPGEVELLTTAAVYATVTTYAAADLMPFADPNAIANTAASSTSVPLAMTTSLSGFTSTSEGAVAAVRELDMQLIAPTGQYVKQFPLGREPGILNGTSVRARVTFGTAVNMYAYMILEF